MAFLTAQALIGTRVRVYWNATRCDGRGWILTGPEAGRGGQEEGRMIESGRIYAGDCLELLPEMPAESVDLIVVDPPFNCDYGYDIYNDSRPADEYIAWCRRWGSDLLRVLRPDGSLWLAAGDEYAAELKVLFHRDLGCHLRSWVTWWFTFGVHCERKFTRSHTHLFHFVSDKGAFTFNADAVRVPSARQLVYRDKRASAKGRVPDDTWVLRPDDVPGGCDPGLDTWSISRVCGTFKERVKWHPCQMPEKALERIIRVSSNPGDLVLDPMAGSGTTLAVAKRLGRRWVGMELSPDYAARAQERVDAVVEGEALYAAS